MKKCPFCAEEIQDEAIKCKHCGEFLDKSSERAVVRRKGPWYFRTTFIVLAVGCVGPLVLPLIWWRPNTSRAWKLGLTAAILVLTWFLYQVTVKSMAALSQYYQVLQQF